MPAELRLVIETEELDTQFRAADLKLDRILRALKDLGDSMSAQLDTLKANVTELTSVNQSAIALLNGLSAQIAALKDDPIALQQLADDIKADSTAMAAAVTANTPPSQSPSPAKK